MSNGHNQTVILGSDTPEIERALLKMVKSDLAGLEMTAGGRACAETHAMTPGSTSAKRLIFATLANCDARYVKE